MKSTRTRGLIESAIENKVVDSDMAAAWHLETAKAVAVGVLPPGSQNIEEHLRRAEERSSSEEIKIMREATELKALEKDLEKRKKELLSKSPKSVSEAVAAIVGIAERLVEWRELRVGKSKIRVIDDEKVFELLCKRKAPGAAVACGWDKRMKKLCGKVFVVRGTWTFGGEYTISHHDGIYLIPFDACSLVEY